MRSHWPYATIGLAILIPLLWVFGSTLTGARVFAYRDTAHFYYPLYAWIANCWSQGEVPLWNPQDNLGTPIAAEATSAVFYPGQALFQLPLPYTLAFNLYVVVHVLLAAGGTFLLARLILRRLTNAGEYSVNDDQAKSDSSRSLQPQLRLFAASLAGISYAFCGTVLFQYCNIVFLIGAAWLPFALWAADHMLVERRLVWSLALGVFLALMVLGGDPQMAYHAGLLAAWLAIVQYWKRCRNKSQVNTPSCSRPSFWQHALVLLATAATTGVLLSAVQIVPSVAATKTSQRVTSREGTTTLERVFGIPSQDTHEAQRYGFSIAPWRLLECVWPNVSGHLFPINRRWMFAERREDRIWSPTLYLGLLPFVCALMAWRIRSKTAELSWLSLFAVGAILASFGRNGLGCLARELQMWWTGRPPTLAIGEPVGGLYWLMVQLLPGYGYFRYPAKLFTVASLAISLLAAVGLLQVLTGDRRRVCRLLLVLFCVSVIGGMTLLTTGPRWSEWLTNARGDELFGPLDVEGARATCLTACIHTALLALLLWWLLARSAWPPTGVAVSLLLVTAVELAVSNGSHVLTASKQVMDAHSVFDYIDTPAVHTPTSLTRIYRHPQRTWVPSSWTTTSDSQRGEQVAEWDRATLFPKHHLSRSLGSVQSYNTLYSREYRAMLRADGGDFPPPEILSLLGVEYLVLPEKIEWPIGEPLDPESRLPENVRIWKNADVMPRAWIVHQFEPWGRRRSSDPAVLQKQWRKLLYGPGSDRRSLRTAAVVDSNQWMSQQTRGKAEGETCHVLLERTNRFELDVVLGQPGLVVVSNQFDDGWSVERITNDIRSAEEILCTNGVMLGVRLPAGRHRLVFRYAPLGYLPSVVVTLTCWLGCLGYGLRQVMMHWRQHNGTPIIAGIV